MASEEPSKIGFLATIGGAYEFAQQLPVGLKVGLSVTLYVVTTLIVAALWLPSNKTDKSSEDQSSPDLSTTSKAVTATLQEGAGAFLTGGSAHSQGQIGGITAGNFYNQVPVTDQQKEEAIYRLKSELTELSEFPDRSEEIKSPTILEMMLLRKSPIRLFNLLERFFRDTILSFPNIGDRLRAYQKQYYVFRTNEQSIEQQMRQVAIEKAAIHIDGAWNAYVVYAVQREAGFDKAKVVRDGGSALSMWGITEQNAEEVFQEINKAPDLDARFKKNLLSFGLLISEAEAILKELHK